MLLPPCGGAVSSGSGRWTETRPLSGPHLQPWPHLSPIWGRERVGALPPRQPSPQTQFPLCAPGEGGEGQGVVSPGAWVVTLLGSLWEAQRTRHRAPALAVSQGSALKLDEGDEMTVLEGSEQAAPSCAHTLGGP